MSVCLHVRLALIGSWVDKISFEDLPSSGVSDHARSTREGNVHKRVEARRGQGPRFGGHSVQGGPPIVSPLIFFFFFEDTSPFCGATDTPVLNFSWYLPWISRPQ